MVAWTPEGICTFFLLLLLAVSFHSESSLPSSASASVLEKNLHVIRDKPELKQKLKDLLESAKTLTAKENLLSSLR